MNRTAKDWDITICADLKSVIESGAPQYEWDALVRAALKLHLSLHQLATNPKELPNESNQ